MASDYQQQINPARDYAERRGIAVNPYVAEIDLKAQRIQRCIGSMDAACPETA